MTIPKPSQTKQPILKRLAQSKKPVKLAAVTESVGKHFKLTKKEMAEEMPKGGKRFAARVGVAVNEMKSAGLVRSPRHGLVAITPKGRTGLKTGTVTDGRKPGRPKTQTTKQPSATPIKRDDKMVQRTADIVSSYVGKKAVSVKQMPELIESVYATLQGLGSSKKLAVKRKYTRRKKIAKKKA